MELRVMGLDLSYMQTGVCAWDGVQAHPYRVRSTKTKSYIERAQEIRAGIWEILPEHHPEVFIIEAPLVHAPRAELLTGLFFLVMDRLHYLLKSSFCPIQGIVVLPNPSMRKIMGVSQGRGSKEKLSKTEFKAKIVVKAQELIGPGAPEMSHDEADAFHLAYLGRRFWVDWKCGGVDLSEDERAVWYSEEPTKKISRNPRKPRKRKSPAPKKKGLIYRQGEFLFLPPER